MSKIVSNISLSDNTSSAVNFKSFIKAIGNYINLPYSILSKQYYIYGSDRKALSVKDALNIASELRHKLIPNTEKISFEENLDPDLLKALCSVNTAKQIITNCFQKNAFIKLTNFNQLKANKVAKCYIDTPLDTIYYDVRRNNNSVSLYKNNKQLIFNEVTSIS